MDLNQFSVPGQTKTASTMTFPFEEEYDVTLGCSSCFVEEDDRWSIKMGHGHTCYGSILFVKKKNDSSGTWTLIRDRKSDIFGKTYKLCLNFPDTPCPKNDRKNCTFAHSQEEMEMWNAEKFEGLDTALFKERLKMELENTKEEDSIRQPKNCMRELNEVNASAPKSKRV